MIYFTVFMFSFCGHYTWKSENGKKKAFFLLNRNPNFQNPRIILQKPKDLDLVFKQSANIFKDRGTNFKVFSCDIPFHKNDGWNLRINDEKSSAQYEYPISFGKENIFKRFLLNKVPPVEKINISVQDNNKKTGYFPIPAKRSVFFTKEELNEPFRSDKLNGDNSILEKTNTLVESEIREGKIKQKVNNNTNLISKRQISAIFNGCVPEIRLEGFGDDLSLCEKSVSKVEVKKVNDPINGDTVNDPINGDSAHETINCDSAHETIYGGGQRIKLLSPVSLTPKIKKDSDGLNEQGVDDTNVQGVESKISVEDFDGEKSLILKNPKTNLQKDNLASSSEPLKIEDKVSESSNSLNNKNPSQGHWGKFVISAILLVIIGMVCIYIGNKLM